MESNWRFNVWKYGLVNYDLGFLFLHVEMCARVLSGPLAGKIVANQGIGPNYLIFQNLGDIQGWVFQGHAAKPPGQTRFPFGFDVEPD